MNRERKVIAGKIPITVRLTPRQFERYEKMKVETGLSGEALIRSLLDGAQVKARPTAETVRLTREINKIGNNINQIAWVANSKQTVSPDTIEMLMTKQDEIMRMVRSLIE